MPPGKLIRTAVYSFIINMYNTQYIINSKVKVMVNSSNDSSITKSIGKNVTLYVKALCIIHYKELLNGIMHYNYS